MNYPKVYIHVPPKIKLLAPFLVDPCKCVILSSTSHAQTPTHSPMWEEPYNHEHINPMHTAMEKGESVVCVCVRGPHNILD